MESESRYALSFTSGALLSREAVVAATVYLEAGDWVAARSRLVSMNLLQARTASSAARLAREIVQRMAMLTPDELQLLVEASPSERDHLAWLAVCRRYDFLGDFAEEVVRERFLLLTPSLGYNEFDSFVRGKELWHSELAELKHSTLQKLRSTVFQMLTEAGLLADGEVIQVVLSERVRGVLDLQVPSDVRFFPVAAEKGAAR